jgi:hypothetical protein
MSEPIDYAAVLSDLKARRAAIDQAIGGIEALVGSGELPTLGPIAGTGNGASSNIEPDAFYRLNTVDAAKKYLGMTGRKAQSTEQIVDALRRGGLTVKPETISSLLQRAAREPNSEVRRVARGMWGLAAWYDR